MNSASLHRSRSISHGETPFLRQPALISGFLLDAEARTDASTVFHRSTDFLEIEHSERKLTEDRNEPFIYSRSVYGLFGVAVALLAVGIVLLLLELFLGQPILVLLGTATCAVGAFFFSWFLRRGQREYGSSLS